MKNIHIISTDKSSRLAKLKDNLFYITTENIPSAIYQNIYITSDKEIKEGDWFTLDMSHSSTLPDEIHQMGSDNWSKTGGIHFCEGNSWIKSCKKIILTTDQELIKDGVQAIDDEFLEWFVDKANDSGKSIDIVETKHIIKDYVDDQDAYGYDVSYYKIIIPSQEILPEQIFNEEKSEGVKRDAYNTSQERNYEDMEEYANYCLMCSAEKTLKIPLQPKEWFKQFKNK